MQRFDKLSANGMRALLALIGALFCALALPAAAQTFPKFTGLVVDDANVLPPRVEQDLTAKLEALQRDTKRQLVVATIADMQGYPLDEYGYRLGRAWGVGLKDVDNGAILFVAPNNPAGQRGPRIEVGRGLEPILTDAFSSVTIREQMIPRLRAGDLPGAMIAGTDALVQQLRSSPEEAQARLDAATKDFDRTHQRAPGGQRNGGGGGGGAMIIGAMILGFFILSMFRRSGGSSGVRGGGKRYRGGDGGIGSVLLWTIASEVASSALRGGRGGGSSGWGGGGGSGWGGGGGSDGSWGGGGFTGGGGGDFGGGGASGDW